MLAEKPITRHKHNANDGASLCVCVFVLANRQLLPLASHEMPTRRRLRNAVALMRSHAWLVSLARSPIIPFGLHWMVAYFNNSGLRARVSFTKSHKSFQHRQCTTRMATSSHRFLLGRLCVPVFVCELSLNGWTWSNLVLQIWPAGRPASQKSRCSSNRLR